MENKFDVALSEYPITMEALLREIDDSMIVERLDENYVSNYKATLNGCSLDAVDVASEYLQSKDITVALLKETYEGFGITQEQAKIKCKFAYLKDFTEAFSGAANQVEKIYNAIEKMENLAIFAFMDCEESVKKSKI